MGENTEGKTGYQFLLPTLAAMLVFLDDAQKMKTAPRRQSCEEKEPYGPGSRDYFWLVCRLVDNVKKEDAFKSWQEVRCFGLKKMFSVSSRALVVFLQFFVFGDGWLCCTKRQIAASLHASLDTCRREAW